jgi:hypothetical protein
MWGVLLTILLAFVTALLWLSYGFASAYHLFGAMALPAVLHIAASAAAGLLFIVVLSQIVLRFGFATVLQIEPTGLHRGLVLAVLTAVLTSFQQAISAGNMAPTAWDWQAIGGVALAAGVAYLLKNLLSDEAGRFAGRLGAWLALLLAGGALAGCSGLNLGWGAVQQAAPGSAALSVDPGCHGQAPSDLPCLSVTGAQNMDSVRVAIGRDANGKPTFELAAAGIDPARNQAVAAQALQATVQQLGASTLALAPLAATALSPLPAAALSPPRPLAGPAPAGLTPQGQPRVEIAPQ